MPRSHWKTGIGLFTLLSLAIPAVPASASKKNYDRMIDFAGMERMLTQEIAKYVLLVALSVDVADLDLPLREAADHVVSASVKEAAAGNLYSMASVCPNPPAIPCKN